MKEKTLYYGSLEEINLGNITDAELPRDAKVIHIETVYIEGRGWQATFFYDEPTPPVHFHINIDMDYQISGADAVAIDKMLKNEASNFLSMAKQDIEEWATGAKHVKSSSTATCAIPRSDI